MTVALAAGALWPLAARADIDWGMADWGAFSPDALSYWSYAEMAQRSYKYDDEKSSSKSEPEDPLSVAYNLFKTGEFKEDKGLDQLARLFPREEFYDRKKQFRQLVMAFNESVDKLYGVPANNLATGLTVALAGAYSAYHNREFPEKWVKPLYRQMEGMLLKDPRLPKRGRRDKANDYQVLVGVGMMLLAAQADVQKNPGAASQQQLRQAGASALKALLQTDLERVEFSAKGIKAR